MTVASFGACTQLPLADCPFKGSPLTVADAQEEVARQAGRERHSVCEEVPAESLPEVEAPRMSLQEIMQARIVRYPAPVPDTIFAIKWGRLTRVPREEVQDAELVG